MSQINVNRIKDSNEGAPDFPSGVNVGGITSTVTLGVTNLNPTNLNVSGVVTATTLDGNLLATGTPTLGLGVTINTSGVNISGVATAGIVSATTLYGDGTNLTGIALTIAPLNYNPAVLGSNLVKTTGIGLTFNQGVKAGSGNVTLSIANAGVAGTVVENFGVGNSVTYGHSDYGTTVTISPTSSLNASETYHLSYPSGAFTNLGGDVSYVGTAYTFGVKDTLYELWAWGQNNYGQLGLNSRTDYSSPVQIPGTTWGSDISNLAATQQFHVSFVKTDGTLWSWGYNYYGGLGFNNRTNYSSPTQVPGTTWSKSHTGNYNTYAIKTDGTLWSVGFNQQGELGLNDTVMRSSPTQIPGTTWSSVASGNIGAWGIKTDGTLWAWGDNELGSLGLIHTVNTSSPVQIPGTTWKQVTGGQRGGLAVKTDGTLWSWGYNIAGKLGQNQAKAQLNAVSSPVQIPGTNWSKGFYNGHYPFAIRTDGTLWTWGQNNQGQLGLNSRTYYSSPVQVPGTTWREVRAGYDGSTIATKTDGTLWSWGFNEHGQIDHNDRTNRSSPVQIGSTTGWTQPLTANHASFAIKEV